jgi:glutathione peroxidase
MTTKQSLLKTFYPLLMKAGKIFGLRSGIKKNQENIAPRSSFYHLSATAIDGSVIDFNGFREKHVLVVNIASGCGYTNQLSDLKKLYDLYNAQLEIVAFPSNDFKEQEKLSDAEIASFCAVNFAVSFLLTKKTVVTQGERQHEVFRWLTNEEKNGWNSKTPEWNFSKYLINKKGVLTHYFGPGVEPLSDDITSELKTEKTR